MALHQMKPNDWKIKETRCSATVSSGKRCKLTVQAGDYLCEHHAMDLPHFVQNPNYVAGLMKARFPKRHHPACDRKGQNDCSCHTFSNGALAVMSLRESFAKSQQLSPLYRRKRRLEHRLKVKKIRAYYNSITEAELWMPKDSGFRQFRFFLWDDKKERMVVRVVKDNFRHKRTLLKWLRKLAPLHVYYTTSAWLNPEGIGPDPKGKHGRSKMKKKGWTLNRYHDTMLYQGLYFDVDYDNADYNEGAHMLMKLSETLDEAIANTEGNLYFDHLKGDELRVFSGGKGFHLIREDWSSTEMNREAQKEYQDVSASEGGNQAWSKDVKSQLISELKELDCELLLDWEVTIDPRRIIRLPGTVHGKTLRVCTITSPDDFKLVNGRWTYNASPPI